MCGRASRHARAPASSRRSEESCSEVAHPARVPRCSAERSLGHGQDNGARGASVCVAKDARRDPALRRDLLGLSTEQAFQSPLPIPEQPWQTISMDLITALPQTKSGFDAIVVFVDKLTKWATYAPTTTNVTAPGLVHPSGVLATTSRRTAPVRAVAKAPARRI